MQAGSNTAIVVRGERGFPSLAHQDQIRRIPTGNEGEEYSSKVRQERDADMIERPLSRSNAQTNFPIQQQYNTVITDTPDEDDRHERNRKQTAVMEERINHPPRFEHTQHEGSAPGTLHRKSIRNFVAVIYSPISSVCLLKVDVFPLML